ncbi:MAG: NAD(P)/FAD-dependent oxidoreductase [Bacteroidales bacterium]|jgi:protoporphyrinogen oxidase|nr:NAD(P)/FAD-dependent oxidoreductase [Bacteroidales bacterium]MDD4215249.1 NAD(P)/FAD-dependent oxidoreductase [Bacteroidales bacterium]
MSKTAIIIGAGPAGLTSAYELITRTDIKPLVIEKSNEIGGISKTVNYKGNRIDLGGHRFFSKSDVVMKWWQRILPIQGSESKDDLLKKTNNLNQKSKVILAEGGPDPEKTDKVMLIRNRLSRIFFLRKFFDYPITLNGKTLKNLGLIRIIKIGATYFYAKIFPVKNVKTLEDFFINRFGRELYNTFFRDYTEKVWGVPCNKIAADWGAQRIKELSVTRAILHALKTSFRKNTDIEQKNTDTSLIEQFMYPKHGPGQMWETVAKIIEEKGGTIIRNCEVKALHINDGKITGASYHDHNSNNNIRVNGEYFFSTMPVKELIIAMDNKVPEEVMEISKGLQYRDFITVGLLLNKLKLKNKTNIPTLNELIPDNWIYIQERDVKIGRLQIFNNWSPYMVADIQKVWIGLEYFCNEGDELWSMDDNAFISFAIDELAKIDIIDKNEVIDATLLRMPKTYPAYFGTYSKFHIIRNYTDSFENLFLIGRNGMHKYNNQDHSMLTAIRAVDNIISGETSKEAIWNINTEEEYHEEK